MREFWAQTKAFTLAVAVHLLMAALVAIGTMTWKPFRPPALTGMTIEAVMVDTGAIKERREQAEREAQKAAEQKTAKERRDKELKARKEREEREEREQLEQEEIEKQRQQVQAELFVADAGGARRTAIIRARPMEPANMTQFRSVGLMGRVGSAEVLETLVHLRDLLRARGLRVVVERELAEHLEPAPREVPRSRAADPRRAGAARQAARSKADPTESAARRPGQRAGRTIANSYWRIRGR